MTSTIKKAGTVKLPRLRTKDELLKVGLLQELKGLLAWALHGTALCDINLADKLMHCILCALCCSIPAVIT
jgi:hypothetical protein